MVKQEEFYGVVFSADKISTVLNKWCEKYSQNDIFSRRCINRSKSTVYYDTDYEFYADFNRYINEKGTTGYITKNAGNYFIEVHVFNDFLPNSALAVEAPLNEEVEEFIFEFSKDSHMYKVQETKYEPTIFIGHGGNNQWKELKEHLQDKHGYKIETFETGVRAGFTIKEVLGKMLKNSSMAFIVMTGEDEQKDGRYNARQNVIHEIGLFQGKLGFDKAIVLKEEGAEEFSNIHGIVQLRFSKGRISEIFGDVLATIKRELG